MLVLPKDSLNTLADELKNVRDINNLDIRSYKKQNNDKVIFPGISVSSLKPKLLPNKYKFL
jgi:hypothetical protein